MPRSPATFTQADVSRAVKGASAAGVVIGRVEVDRSGRIVIIAAGTAAPCASDEPTSAQKNPWDEVIDAQ